MKNSHRFYVHGKWVEPVGSGSIAVVNPSTEKEIGQISVGTSADVDLAVAAARDALESFSQTSREERIALLERIMLEYKKRWDEMALCISQEMGAPIGLAKTGQAGAGYQHFASALNVLKSFEFEQDRGNSKIIREPIGVCGLITPWNWPIHQIASKVAPALACGCTMVLKPSEMAPFNAMIFAEVLDAAELPPGVFNLVNGDGPTTGEAMSSHPGIDMMSFTGSTRAGVSVARASADSVKRVVQELGGKSPNILLDDADFEETVMRDVTRMMINAGQSCNAPSRMLVPAARLDEVKSIAAKAVESIVTGDPQDEATTLGPVVSESQWNRVQRYIEVGIEEGCETVTGGTGRPQGYETGYFVKPTVFVGCHNKCTIATEEIFGPVLCILTYTDIDNAVEIANDTNYGLSAYVASSDVQRATAVARRLRAGNVHINGKWGSEPMPFGGYKQSGNGREGGAFGFEDYLEMKAVIGCNASP